jgi:uncharacterized membrane protein
MRLLILITLGIAVWLARYHGIYESFDFGLPGYTFRNLLLTALYAVVGIVILVIYFFINRDLKKHLTCFGLFLFAFVSEDITIRQLHYDAEKICYCKDGG